MEKLIILLPEHKQKLLTLCLEFIPKYNWSWENDFADDLGVINFWEKDKEWHTWKLVHWHQLCLTELFERIWDKVDKYDDDPVLKGIAKTAQPNHKFKLLQKLYENHPVDYLFDFVKFAKRDGWFKK